MLPMAAFQIRNPIAMFILVKTDYFLFQKFPLTLTLSPKGRGDMRFSSTASYGNSPRWARLRHLTESDSSAKTV